MDTVIITTKAGNVNIVYQPDTVDVLVIDLEAGDFYLYKDNFICTISSVSDDGYLNLRCVESIDGGKHASAFLNVPAKDIEFYSSSDEYDDIEYLSNSEWEGC